MVSLLRSRKGRPRSVSREKIGLILKMYWGHNVGIRKIASSVGVSPMTVLRVVRRESIPEPQESVKRLIIACRKV